MKSLNFFSSVGLLITTLLLCAANATAQARRVHLEIEGGLTYNQLYWHVDQIVVVNGSSGSSYTGLPPVTNNRTRFRLLPAMRIGFEVPVMPTNFLSFEPFIGYHQSGGESKKTVSGYQDKYLFRALSPGFFVNFDVSGFNLGTGIRYDKYLTRYSYYHGSMASSDNNNASWERSSANYFIIDHSWNAGVKIGHRIWKAVSLEASGWYGLSNIASNSSGFNPMVWPVQFQLMLSYRL